MRDSLTFRLSGEGEQEFNKSVAAAKKWIAANASGPIKLGFSLGLKLSAPEGESIQEVLATDPLFDATRESASSKDFKLNGAKKGWRCNRCKSGHHEDCKRGDCMCSSPLHGAPEAVEGDF